MRTENYVSAGEVRRWRRMVLITVVLACLAVLMWVAGRVPVSAFAPWVGIAVAVALCVWFPAASRSWKRTDQSQWKDLREATPTLVRARTWTPTPGTVLVGITTAGSATETHDGLAFACWRQRVNAHVLVCGPAGAGKTGTMRWFVTALLQADHDVVIIDGKGGGSVGADFADHPRVRMVAEDPGDWLEATYLVRDEMRTRYAALRAWRYGQAGEPDHRPIGLVVDELEDVCTIAGERFTDPLFEITRMGREAGGRVLASILRPDTSTIPGKVRDSFTGRVFMGALAGTSALMMFDDNAERAQQAASGAAETPGRGVALLGGRIHSIQVPLVPDDRAALAELLPKEATA